MAVTGESENFGLNIERQDTEITMSAKGKISVEISKKSKKMTVSFPKNSDYTYKVYYLKKNAKVFFNESGEKYITPVKGMKNNKIYIIAFWDSHSEIKEFAVDYTVKYYYKKKKKTQVVHFNPKKLSFKLYGNTFKIKRGFKGWSKKKKAKKAKYKPKKKINFTKNGTLKLYCVKKLRRTVG